MFQVSPLSNFFGSDLVETLLGSPWSEMNSISDLIEHLPTNFQGKYHLGSTFPLYLFNQFPIFTCISLNPTNFKETGVSKLVISNTHFFHVQDFQGKAGHLVSYGTLKGIKYIKTSRDNKKLSINWRGPVDLIQVFKSSNAIEIAEVILTSLQKKGIKTKRLKLNQQLIKEEDVSPQWALRVKINEIESEIIETELELERELVKNKINALIQLYQKAIEYYSALGDDKFDGYLGKIRGLMGNPDVLKALTEESQVVVKEESNIAKEIEEQEIWPVNITN